MLSVVNETAACDLSVLMVFPVSLLTDTLFHSRLWQHLWKTTQSTWFHQCSRSCPSSGTPWQKVLLYILGTDWISLESNQTSSVSYPLMTQLLEKHNTWSALPCQTKWDLSVTSRGFVKFFFSLKCMCLLWYLLDLQFTIPKENPFLLYPQVSFLPFPRGGTCGETW